MITAKLKQQDRQWQDFGPPAYRESGLVQRRFSLITEKIGLMEKSVQS
jgi:hypothetical protein